MKSEIKIRKAVSEDANAIWEIFREVVKTGDTYVFDPSISKEDALKSWMGPKYHVYVAESEGNVLGTYILKQNQQDLGSHIANGSYMVAPSGHGKGIGKAMALHSIEEAKKLGFKAMQFNIVVSTNEPAVQLWKKVGFQIIGTIPKGFHHKTLGYVDAYIMYRELVAH
jgi:L-amino acid N-acyltransferase YncA